jgi:hypothetical protein
MPILKNKSFRAVLIGFGVIAIFMIFSSYARRYLVLRFAPRVDSLRDIYLAEQQY